MKGGWVYILKCSDNSYYTGSTSNIEKRIQEHKQSIYKGYTSQRLPVELVYSQFFNEIEQAIRAERKLKKWSKAKKEALIDGKFDTIKELAKKQF